MHPHFVADEDQILLVTDKGKLIRCPVNDIRRAGRGENLLH